MVPVVNDATRGTGPFAVTEAQVLIDEAALSAPPGRRKEAINLNQTTAVPLTLVRQLPDELAPSRIRDGLGEPMIGEHPLHVQAFGVDGLVLVYQPSAQFMEEIAALIGNLLVLASQLAAGFLAALRSLLPTRDATLQSLQSPLGFTKVLGGLNRLALGRDEKRLQTQVNSDLAAPVVRLWHLDFAEDGSVVVAGLGSRNGHVLHRAFDGPVNHHFDWRHFGNDEPAVLYPEALRYSKRLAVVLALEARELGATVEKVAVGSIQVAERLLQGLRVRFFQPLIFRLLFQLSEHQGRVVIRQTLFRAIFVGEVVVNPSTQEVVVHKPACAKLTSKSLLLFGVGVQPKLVRSFDQHATQPHFLCRIVAYWRDRSKHCFRIAGRFTSPLQAGSPLALLYRFLEFSVRGHE